MPDDAHHWLREPERKSRGGHIHPPGHFCGSNCPMHKPDSARDYEQEHADLAAGRLPQMHQPKQRLADAVAAIERERERRHWTIEQWKDSGEEEWWIAIAKCQTEAEEAVSFLLAEVKDMELDTDALQDKLEAELVAAERARTELEEFVIAHTLLEKGVTDFDLHAKTVARFQAASVQPHVRQLIREALSLPVPPPSQQDTK